MLKSINPHSRKQIAVYEEISATQLNSVLEDAHSSFKNWKNESFNSRAELFIKMANLLRERKEEYAILITSEMGKIISESRAEIEKCAWLCEYYAQNAESLLQKINIETDASKSYVQYEPVGIIYGIMPWNFPFWQVLRAAVPTIMAGNTFILKHAPNVIGCGKAIEDLFIGAGFSKNIFSNLLIDIDLSENVIASPLVQGVTLTGSQRAGSAVAALAGKYLKKTVMELGGSDPFIVLKDAEINSSCKTGVCSRMLNAGQVCISAKRFIVVEEIYDEFVKEQKALLESLILGDPMLENTDMGPMARPDLLQGIEKQVEESLKQGAKIISGGKRINDSFYAPTLIVNAVKGMPVYDEETFGPVSVVIPAKDANDAIRIANDTNFGLGASLWTQDMELAENLATKIEAGAVFINGMTKSDPRLPFGGIKQSGYGRELGGLGIKEFVNAKTIWVK